MSEIAEFSKNDLKVRSLQSALETVIDDFVNTNRVSLAAAVGTIEIIKQNLINNGAIQ